MNYTEKNCLPGKHSTQANAHGGENANHQDEERFDFSGIQEYLTRDTRIERVVEDLEEIRIEYLEAELYFAMMEAGNPVLERVVHDNVVSHLARLSGLIRVFKTILNHETD
jgi:hypothetical protein